MAFINTDLTCVEGGGQRTFNYKTVDASGVVEADGYFNPMYENFRLGDVLNIVHTVVETTAAGAAQPHVMTAIAQQYVVIQLNDAVLPRPAADVRIQAFA